MLPSSLPLPHLWNFWLPLPAPDRVIRFLVRFRFQSFLSKCFRFRFHKNLTASTASASRSLLSMKQLIVFSLTKKQASLLCKLFYLTCVVDRAYMEWNGTEDDFSIFHTGNFGPFHTKSLPFHISFHTKIFFQIPFHTSIPKKV